MTLEHQLVILFSKPIWQDIDRKKYELLVCQQLNWEIIFTQLVLHKLSALAHHHMLQCNLKRTHIPRLLAANLENAFYITRMQQQLTRLEVLSLCEKMNTSNIQYCILKGFVLQNILYPSYTRPSRDTDFFINRDDYNKVCELSKPLGFESENNVPDNMTKSERLYLLLNTYEFPLLHKKTDNLCFKRISFDFQHSYSFYRQLNYKTNVTEELNSTVLMKGGGYRQTDINLLIHLCTHTFGDSTVISEIIHHKAFRIRSFADIYGFISKFAAKINNTQFVKKIVDTNTIIPVYFCLHYCKEIYGPTEKLEDLVALLHEHIDDTNFVNMCGMENGMDKAKIWDASLEEKIFNRESVDKIKQVYAPLIQRYKKYDNRFR